MSVGRGQRPVGRVAPVLAGAARVALGILWLLEGITKYRAGFGAADIQLVVQSTGSNPRVPDFYAAFTDTVLGGLSGLFGWGIPLLETGLGVALILGVLTLPAACGSIALLMNYWLADQLVAQYPIMVLLSAVVLLLPAAANAYSVTAVVRHRASSRRDASTLMS